MDKDDSPTLGPESAVAPAATSRKPYFDLLLISFLILFFELACIRFFGSTVVFLTFFTNIVLLACFLGMSVGCMAAGKTRNYINWVLPLACSSVVLAVIVYQLYLRLGKFVIDVGNQASPQLIYFGTEYRGKDPGNFVIPIEVVAGVFFALIALIFVGLGQVMGRAFDAIPSRVGAYTTNVLGSLLGIVGFFAASWFKTTPHLWFLVCAGLCLYFVTRRSWIQIGSALGVLFVVGMSVYSEGNRGQLFWSPYYKILYSAWDGGHRNQQHQPPADD